MGLLSRAGRINTPSQGTWRLCSCKLAFRVGLVGVERSYLDVVFGGMVFGDVVAKVFGTWVPKDTHVFVGDLVDDPKIAHFHGAGSLAFDSVIGDANGGGVVTVNGRGRLGMAHFF